MKTQGLIRQALSYLMAAVSFLCGMPALMARISSDTCTVSISGNELLCPGDTITLRATPGFAAYQWYRKVFFSPDPPEPIAGANADTLRVNWFDDPGFEYTVVASTGACTDTSAPVLVDSYVFLPVVVSNSGTFEIGPEGELLICPGDTVFFEILLPYTVNIQWTKDGADISNANDRVLVVTEPGIYGVRGAPEECPNYINELGVPLTVIERSDCSSPSWEGPSPDEQIWRVYPNPSLGHLIVFLPEPAPAYLRLFDAGGRVLMEKVFRPGEHLDLSGVGAGIFWLQVEQGARRWAGPLQCIR